MNLVYCKECKKYNYIELGMVEWCTEKIHDYYSPKSVRDKVPKEKNKKNDCKDFEDNGLRARRLNKNK